MNMQGNMWLMAYISYIPWLYLYIFLHVILFTECELASNIFPIQETKLGLQVGSIQNMSVINAYITNLFKCNAPLPNAPLLPYLQNWYLHMLCTLYSLKNANWQ